MQIATIEVKWNPPDPRLDNIGLRHDPGGHIYRIFTAEGHRRMFGTSRGPDRDRAFGVAKRAAFQAGFTHYRMLGEDGDPLPLS